MNIKIFRQGKLWIAELPTPYGRMELLCREGERFDVRSLALAERFLHSPEDHMSSVRRSALRFRWLWRPIRLAVNNEERLTVQFKHRITGRQSGIFFADEHSGFKLTRDDILANEVDSGSLSPFELNT